MSINTSTFKTEEPDLTKLLEQVHIGEIQLPDFQRGWVWDDRHIRSLIASVSTSYPIGAVMLLETGGLGVRFKPRRVQGAPFADGTLPRRLILDGQQRITSLYLALRSGRPVPTRTEKGLDIDRVYYLDISKCLDDTVDREEAVVSMPADRMKKSDFDRKVDFDLSSPEKEYQQGFFPLDLVFDQDRYSVWRRGYQRHFRQEDSRLDQFDRFEAQVLQRFLKYRVPTIELTRDTPKAAVCQVFEKVNTGGVALTVFELATATFAADDFDLLQDWRERYGHLAEKPILQSVEATDFLQAVTLLASFKAHQKGAADVGCKRKHILALTLDQYRANADAIERGLMMAARLLVRENIYDDRNLPYQSQLTPLSAICACLDGEFDADAVKAKLTRWYWAGVLGELYGGSTETRFSNDLEDVLLWVRGGEEPRTLRDASFAPVRLLTLQTRQSAAYKGIMALLMQAGCHDFINGDPIEVTTYFEQAVDIHHIFPKAYCIKSSYPERKWNSIVNKTAITAKTNNILKAKPPSEYLESIEKGRRMDTGRLDAVLRTHLVDPRHLRSDAFDNFIVDRASKLLDLIERAMGKTVAGRDVDEVVQEFGRALSPSQERQAS